MAQNLLVLCLSAILDIGEQQAFYAAQGGPDRQRLNMHKT